MSGIVSLSDVKKHLRVDGIANDEIITSYLNASESLLRQKTDKDWSVDNPINCLASLWVKENVASLYFKIDNEKMLNDLLSDLKDIALGRGSL